MTRRTKGPKRNAEAYARARKELWIITSTPARQALAAAWMAGYRAAARARRIARPKPKAPSTYPAGTCFLNADGFCLAHGMRHRKPKR